MCWGLRLRVLFSQLSVFPSGFPVSAVRATVIVDGNVAEILEILRRHSLLEWDLTRNWYQLHDLVREFSLLQPRGQNGDAAERRFFGWYFSLLEWSSITDDIDLIKFYEQILERVDLQLIEEIWQQFREMQSIVKRVTTHFGDKGFDKTQVEDQLRHLRGLFTAEQGATSNYREQLEDEFRHLWIQSYGRGTFIDRDKLTHKLKHLCQRLAASQNLPPTSQSSPPVGTLNE